MANLVPAPKPPTREIGTTAPTATRYPATQGWGYFIQEGENVPELQWPGSIRWYEQMLFGDSMVNQMWLSFAMPLSEYVWAINPNGADPAMTERMAADLGLPVGLPSPDDEDEYTIEPGLFTFNFLAHLEEALLAVPFGNYPFEKVGVIALDGYWHLQKLAPRHPATVMEMRQTPQGDLVAIRQFSAGIMRNGLADPPPIPASSLAMYVWRPDARARWIGRPMLRPIYRNWLIRDILIRVDAINHERAGGVPGIETDETFSGASLTDLQALAVNFRVGEDSGYALPPGAKLVLNKLGGTDVVRSLEYHDNQIAGQWRSMVEQLGQTAQGNRALGQTFAGLQDLAQRAVARWFSGLFRESVIRFWWETNVERAADGTLPRHPLLAWRPPKGSATDPVAPSAPPRAVPETPASEQPAAPVPPQEVAARGAPDPTLPAAPGEGAGRNGKSGSERVESITRRTLGALPPRVGAGGGGVRGLSTVTGVAPGTPAKAAQVDPAPPLSLPARPMRREPYPHEIRARTDFAALELRHDNGEAQAQQILERDWLPGLYQQMADRIRELGDSPSPAKLAAIQLAPPDSESLNAVLLSAAQHAADDAGAELAAQGVAVGEAKDAALKALIRGQADAMARQVAAGVTLAGVRKAVQIVDPVAGTTATDLAAGVDSYLGALAHQWEADQMRGAVSTAINNGRFARFQLVEAPATYYASELLDDSTCEACADVDGTEYATLAEATAEYSGGGYNECFGGPRCRGTVVAVAGSEV